MMKLLLLTILFLFSQQVFVTDLYYKDKNCNTQIIARTVYQVNKCLWNEESRYSIVKHRGDNYVYQLNCNQRCENCQQYVNRYGCSYNYVAYRYGPVESITETGFYRRVYKDQGACSGPIGSLITHLEVSQFCRDRRDLIEEKYKNNTDTSAQKLNEEFLKSSSQSYKMGWDSAKRGVNYEEYSSTNCRGSVTRREFFPGDRCVSVGGIITKFTKNF